MVKEPSVFKPLKFYCINIELFHLLHVILGATVAQPVKRSPAKLVLEGWIPKSVQNLYNRKRGSIAYNHSLSPSCCRGVT